MAISYIQSTNSFSSTSSSTTNVIAFSSSITANNLVIVAVSYKSTTATATITDTQGNSYTSAVGPTVNAALGGTGFSNSIFYALAKTSGANTVTVTFSTSVAYQRVAIHEYNGVNTLDVTGSATGTGGTPSSSSATTNYANELVFGWGVSDNGLVSADTGFTVRETSGSESTEDKIVSSTGSQAATYPTDASAWIVQMATFYQATPPQAPLAWLYFQNH